MNVSRFFSFTFLLLIHKVSAQQSVKGVLGDAVVLPCLIEQNPRDVFWLYRDSTTVCGIIDGKVDFGEQDPAYKDRVKTFPSETEKGNFSISLSNLKESDAGTYTCSAPNLKTLKLELTVTAEKERVIKPATTTSPNGQSPRRADDLLTFLLGSALLYSLTF